MGNDIRPGLSRLGSGLVRERKKKQEMFGYVTGNWKEFNKDQQARYGAVYCGICRRLQAQSGGISRLGLSLSLIHISEPTRL